MSPTVPTLDAPDQQFFTWLGATVCVYAARFYGLFMYPIWTQTPGVLGEPEVDQFWLACPQLQGPNTMNPAMLIGQSTMQVYSGINGQPGVGDLVAIVVATLALPNPAPKPLNSAPPQVPQPTPAPPPPGDPVGASFGSTAPNDYYDLGSPTIAIGGEWVEQSATSAHPAGTFVKQAISIIGMTKTFWTLKS